MDVGEKWVRNRLPLSLPPADGMEFAISLGSVPRGQEEADGLTEQGVSETWDNQVVRWIAHRPMPCLGLQHQEASRSVTSLHGPKVTSANVQISIEFDKKAEILKTMLARFYKTTPDVLPIFKNAFETARHGRYNIVLCNSNLLYNV
ncbi:hypothetical protein llap_19782 [Limosa lapponica baueri]|uniref:Uncharacterized protein n=1 Tax=Limosa lapponica baueri TaxID=1758121 RepID=A0A2I0T7Y6_LIMLA|nr:hypothetical protein llap_19782 [Limosa lapponica baueri]